MLDSAKGMTPLDAKTKAKQLDDINLKSFDEINTFILDKQKFIDESIKNIHDQLLNATYHSTYDYKGNPASLEVNKGSSIKNFSVFVLGIVLGLVMSTFFLGWFVKQTKTYPYHSRMPTKSQDEEPEELEQAVHPLKKRVHYTLDEEKTA
mmetsp:Transcript_33016/g.32150  ORF Transcript_33016/g.32150 Transcript_33016/m.32150 type:complete len:150 (-) Transcript_33016:6-455(-)